MPRPFLPLAAALLLPAALLAQSNATTELMTYGDVLGSQSQARLSGATPSTPAFLVPSFLKTGSGYLVAQTGDPADQLAVGIDLAFGGTYFTGTTDANGNWTRNFGIPNNPALLDRDVYFQAFTRPGGGGAGEYDDFSNLRWINLNNAGRWQGAGSDLPVASALVASAVLETGANGRAVAIFSCGGGPLLVTDVSNPYPTTDKAWIYDSRRGTTTELLEVMNTGRAFHTATLLQDGRVLVTGGVTYGGQKPNGDYFTKVLSDAEVWDPVAGSFTAVPMSQYRAGHTANLLPDGRVLVAGGTKGNGLHELTDVADLLGTSNKDTELFDPATNSFSAGPWMTEPKAGHGGVTLQDGRVWLGGGITFTTIFGIPIPDFSTKVNLYDPATNTIGSGGNVGNARALFGSTLMADGRVAVIAGAGGDIFNIGPLTACHLWDPNGNVTTFLATLPTDNAFGGVVQLPTGELLVAGGAGGTLDDPVPDDTLYRIDPLTGALTTLSPMLVDHAGGVTVLLEDGTLYVGGGESNAGLAVVNAESYSY